MSEFNITVEGGSSVKLPTAGKYCDRDILITSTGGSEDLQEVLTEQRGLIETLQTKLSNKASGGGGVNIETLTGTVIQRFMLGDNPDYAYMYIDESFNIRVIVPERGESADIKIIKNTFVITANDWGLAELSEEELYSYFLNKEQRSYPLKIIVPTEDNFEVSYW